MAILILYHEDLVFNFTATPMYLQVYSAEKKFLESPRHDQISVTRVLEFRDDVDEAMEALGHQSHRSIPISQIIYMYIYI